MSDLYEDEEDEYDFDVAELDAAVASKSSKRAPVPAKTAASATAAAAKPAVALAKSVPAAVALAPDEYAADEFDGVSKSSANAYGDDAFEDERSVSRAVAPLKPATATAAASASAVAKRASASVSTKSKPVAAPLKAPVAADADEYDGDDFEAASRSVTRPGSAAVAKSAAAAGPTAATPAKPTTSATSKPAPAANAASTPLKPAAAASSVAAVAATPVPAAASKSPSPPVSSPRTLEPSYSQEHLPTASSASAAGALGAASKPRPSDDGPVDYDNHAGSRPMSARPTSAHPSKSRPTSAHPSNSRPTSAANLPPAASSSAATKPPAAKPGIPTVPKPVTVAAAASAVKPAAAASVTAAPTAVAAKSASSMPAVAVAKPTTPTAATKPAATTPLTVAMPAAAASSVAAPAPAISAPAATLVAPAAVAPISAASPSAALTHALLAAAGGDLALESAGSILVRDEDDDDDGDYDDDFEEAIAKAQQKPTSAVNLSAARATQQPTMLSSPPAVKPAAPVVTPTSPTAAKPVAVPAVSATSAAAAKPAIAATTPASPVAAKAPTTTVAAAAPDTGARAVPSSKKVAPAAAAAVAPRPPPATVVAAASAPVAPKTVPPPRKPAAATAPAAAPTSPVAATSDPKKAAEYDRARREIMKAQRLKDAAAAKEKARIAALELREKDAAAAAPIAEEEKEAEVKRANKAPIQPPPAFSPLTSPLHAGRASSSPIRTQPRAPAGLPGSARKGQHQIHPHVAPAPWEQFRSNPKEEEEEEEEKQQFSPRAPRSPTRSSRARPPRYGAASSTARPGTAASSYSFAPFSPSSTARPSTSAAAFRVADAWSLNSGRRTVFDGALETQRLVHRAAEILRAFSETDPSPLVTGPPFQPLRRPANATAHADVPRCYPRGAVQTPRVSTARFKRTRAFNGGLTGPQPHYYAQDRSAAISAASTLAGSRTARQGSWDVSAELSYGHAIIEGLRARTQTLASAVESRGISLAPQAPTASSTATPTVSLGLPPRPSSAQHQAQHHSDLLQSLAVTSSLESYYSLLSRLDISVQKSQQHESQLQHIMFQPTISMPPQPPSSQQQTQQQPPKRSPGSTRPGSAVSHYRHASAHDDASLLAAEQETGWVHPSSAAGGLHADYSLKRPTSGRRTHPLAPPSQIPPYDSLLDPHVRSVLGPAQRRVIESTRQEELADAPELRGMFETRSRNFDEEREVEETLRAEEIKRKRRQDRPQEERISQRPRSATGTSSAASHQQKASKSAAAKRGGQPAGAASPAAFASSSAAIPPAQKAARDMPTRIKQVSSAYAAGNSAALPPDSKLKTRRPAAPAASARSRHASDPVDDVSADDEEDYLAADESHRTLDSTHHVATAAAGAPVFAECDISLIVDWHALSSLWASDEAAGLLDRELASLGLLGEAVGAPLNQSTRPGAASKSHHSRDFFSAERCLQSLHAQLGLPFEVSSPGPDFAPSLRHVAALKAAVSGLLDCKALVVRIIETIGLREQIVRALNAGAAAPTTATEATDATEVAAAADPVSTPMELLSQLAQADSTLLELLADYSAAFRERFGDRAEFCPPLPQAGETGSSEHLSLPFVFRGEDYGLKVSRERAQLLHFYNTGREALEEGAAAVNASRPASAAARAPSAARSRGDRVRSAARERRAAAVEAPLPAPDLSAAESSEAAIAHLAATHLHQRPPSEIASAAAAIVLSTLAQQARQQHSASRHRS